MKQTKTDNFFTRYPLAVVFLFAFICLCQVMLLRDYSPSNELRYLNIVDEALANGNFFAFTNQGVPYADKPPLYFWLMMLSRALFGKHVMFALAMFSFIPALVIIWIMDRWVRLETASERAAFALMMTTSVMFLGMSIFLRMDMLMCMFIVLAMYTFYRMYEGDGDRKKLSILLPIWIFLALFTKGPVGFLVPPVSILCFLIIKGKWRETGKYLGWKTWGIIAGLCILWFTGVYIDGGKEYLNNLLFHQTVGRAVHSFHHKAPFWYYLAAVWYTMFPYCILLVGTIIAALLKPKGEKRSVREVLFLTVIISTVVMLSAFSSKLSIYLAPVFPFMVMLFPVVKERIGWKKWMTVSLAIPSFIFIIAGIGALIAIMFLRGNKAVAGIYEQYPFISSPLVTFAVILLIAGNALALWALLKQRCWSKCVFYIASALLLVVWACSSLMPKINDYIGYGNLCEAVPEDTEVVTLYVRRPENMNVYLGRNISDYEKDFNAFYKAEIENRQVSDGPVTLLFPESKLEKDPSLKSFVQEHTQRIVGPYCLITITPEAQN